MSKLSSAITNTECFAFGTQFSRSLKFFSYICNKCIVHEGCFRFFLLPLCLCRLAVRYFRWIKSTRQPSHVRLRKIRTHYSHNMLIDFLPNYVINRSHIRKFKFLKRPQATASLQPVPHFQQIQQKCCMLGFYYTRRM